MKAGRKSITTVIWDWNGTLLNDAGVCIECMNVLLSARGLKLLDRERYLEIFTFPVKEYYLAAGFTFDKEPFEVPAHEFIRLYREKVKTSPLQDNVIEILQYLENRGYTQAVLSAMEKDLLLETMHDKAISHYFKIISGIQNHLAEGKTVAALRLMKDLHCNPENTVIIGDTLHDAEIARSLDIECILVSIGHQSYSRLLASGYRVITSLEGLYEIL